MKKLQIILSILLLLTCTSCGVLSKHARHAKHEAHHVDSTSTAIAIVNDVTTKGDSIVHIPGSSLDVVVPLTLDSLCADHTDSVITDNVKLYFKPVYHFADNGKKVFKGMQVKAITMPKTIKPGYVKVERSSVNIQGTTYSKKDSSSSVSVVSKKRDNRLGGYTTIIIIISLLCVGWYIVKKSKIKFF